MYTRLLGVPAHLLLGLVQLVPALTIAQTVALRIIDDTEIGSVWLCKNVFIGCESVGDDKPFPGEHLSEFRVGYDRRNSTDIERPLLRHRHASSWGIGTCTQFVDFCDSVRRNPLTLTGNNTGYSRTTASILKSDFDDGSGGANDREVRRYYNLGSAASVWFQDFDLGLHDRYIGSIALAKLLIGASDDVLSRLPLKVSNQAQQRGQTSQPPLRTLPPVTVRHIVRIHLPWDRLGGILFGDLLLWLLVLPIEAVVGMAGLPWSGFCWHCALCCGARL